MRMLVAVLLAPGAAVQPSLAQPTPPAPLGYAYEQGTHHRTPPQTTPELR